MSTDRARSVQKDPVTICYDNLHGLAMEGHIGVKTREKCQRRKIIHLMSDPEGNS